MSERPIRRRNIDPDVSRARSAVAVAAHQRRPDAEIAELKAELQDAVLFAAARKVAAQLPELSPHKREKLRAILLGGAA